MRAFCQHDHRSPTIEFDRVHLFCQIVFSQQRKTGFEGPATHKWDNSCDMDRHGDVASRKMRQKTWTGDQSLRCIASSTYLYLNVLCYLQSLKSTALRSCSQLVNTGPMAANVHPGNTCGFPLLSSNPPRPRWGSVHEIVHLLSMVSLVPLVGCASRNGCGEKHRFETA